jgi:hypothetical protein
MAKKVKKPKRSLGVAGDIRVSFNDALKYLRGERTDVTVHRVVPHVSKARQARMTLGLSQRPGRT